MCVKVMPTKDVRGTLRQKSGAGPPTTTINTALNGKQDGELSITFLCARWY